MGLLPVGVHVCQPDICREWAPSFNLSVVTDRSRFVFRQQIGNCTQRNLQSEISTLGYPKAALFGFAVALVASNVFAVVTAALESAKHADLVVADMPLSNFAIVNGARSAYEGMDVVLDEAIWEQFHAMAPRTFAKHLRDWVKNADWERFRKAVRGPKKPVPKRTRFKNTPHVSTARLLAE